MLLNQVLTQMCECKQRPQLVINCPKQRPSGVLPHWQGHQPASVVCRAYLFILYICTTLPSSSYIPHSLNRNLRTVAFQLKTVLTMSHHCRTCLWTSAPVTFQRHLCGCLLPYAISSIFSLQKLWKHQQLTILQAQFYCIKKYFPLLICRFDHVPQQRVSLNLAESVILLFYNL